MHCNTLNAYLAISSTCRGYCSPPKAHVQQKPCSLGHEARRKHWEGAGTWPHTIKAPNMSGAGRGGAGDLGEAGTWLKAHWKYGINHNTGSNSVLLCDLVTTSSPILQSAKQLSPLDKLHSFCGSAPLHRGFCRLTTYKIQLIGQSR